MDRRQALSKGEALPDRTRGAALLADISGFTPLTQALAEELGRKAGAEEVLRQINPVYQALIVELHRYQGEYAQARDFLEQALDTYHQLGDRRGESSSLIILGIVLRAWGDITATRDRLEQALHICRRTGDRMNEGATLGNIGNLLIAQGDYAQAGRYLELAIGISREVGNRAYEGHTLLNIGECRRHEGKHSEAQSYTEEGVQILHEVGDQQAYLQGLSNLGLLAHLAGDNESARTYSQQALVISQETGYRRGEAFALTNLGHALLELGDLEGAAQSYQEGLAIRRELGEYSLIVESLAGLARVALASGEPTQALVLVEEILPYCESDPLLGEADEPFQVYVTCYQVLKTSGDSRAQQVLATAHRLLQEKTARIPDAETRRSFQEDVVAHREIVASWEVQQGDRAGQIEAGS